MRRFHPKPSTPLESTLQALQLYRIATSPLALSPFVRRSSTSLFLHFVKSLLAPRTLLTWRDGVRRNWAHHSREITLLDNYCWSRSLLLPSLLSLFYWQDHYFWRFRTFVRITPYNSAWESDIDKNHENTWTDSFCSCVTREYQPRKDQTLNLLGHWIPLRGSSEDLRFKIIRID